jgi:hypothetical protein
VNKQCEAAAAATPGEWELPHNSTKRWKRLVKAILEEAYVLGPDPAAKGRVNKTRLFKFAKKMWKKAEAEPTLTPVSVPVDGEQAGLHAGDTSRLTFSELARLAHVITGTQCVDARAQLLAGATRSGRAWRHLSFCDNA